MIDLFAKDILEVTGGRQSKEDPFLKPKEKTKKRRSVREIRHGNNGSSKSSNRAAAEAICGGLNKTTGKAVISHSVDVKVVKVTTTAEVSCKDL